MAQTLLQTILLQSTEQQIIKQEFHVALQKKSFKKQLRKTKNSQQLTYGDQTWQNMPLKQT